MIGAGACLSLLLFTGGVALGYVNYRFGQITRFDVAIDVAPASGEPRNYLLVGSDSRAGLDPDDPANAGFFDDEGTITTESSQRTDTIMVLRVDPDTGEAWLLSFPRDLWVPIADTGESNRINVAFTRGRDVLADTIRQNFGIPIHHYVEVDFVGFQGLVRAIDGVPFYFSEPVRDPEVGLLVPEPGCVTLDATQALNFVRSRHLEIQDLETGRWRTDPSADRGRISRQQAFIRRSVSRAVSKGLSNPVTLRELVDVGVQFVGLDPTFDVSDILSLGRRFADFDSDALQTYSLPATDFRTAGGAAVLDLDERAAEPIFNIFRGLDPDAVTPSLVGVTVLNGTGEPGFAADVSVALEEIGFDVHDPADTVDPFERSVVYYAPGSENAAIRLAQHLTAPVLFGTDTDLEPGEVVLVAGFDFTTVHDQPSPTVPELPTTTTTTTSSTLPENTAPLTTLVGDDPSTTTTTEPIGYLPGEAPPGVSCG